MNDQPEESTTSKSPKLNVMMVDKTAFKAALEILSLTIQGMGDEIEALRQAKTFMHPQARQDMIQLVAAHLNNASVLSNALQECVYDAEDPKGDKTRHLN